MLAALITVVRLLIIVVITVLQLQHTRDTLGEGAMFYVSTRADKDRSLRVFLSQLFQPHLLVSNEVPKAPSVPGSSPDFGGSLFVFNPYYRLRAPRLIYHYWSKITRLCLSFCVGCVSWKLATQRRLRGGYDTHKQPHLMCVSPHRFPRKMDETTAEEKKYTVDFSPVLF